jgi:hypothetical protein
MYGLYGFHYPQKSHFSFCELKEYDKSPLLRLSQDVYAMKEILEEWEAGVHLLWTTEEDLPAVGQMWCDLIAKGFFFVIEC